MHHALGHAGGARGVDQRGQVVDTPYRVALHGLAAGADGVPVVIRLQSIWRRQRVADAWHASRHAGLHAFPAVELAHEAGFGLAVLQNLAHRVGRQRGVERYRHVARHPDGEVAHHPPGTVFGQNRDLGAGLPALGLQVGGHAPHLVANLCPGEVLYRASAHGLGEGHFVGRRFFPVVQALQGQEVGRDVCHGCVSNGGDIGPI